MFDDFDFLRPLSIEQNEKKAPTVNLNVKLDLPTVCELAGRSNFDKVLSI